MALTVDALGHISLPPQARGRSELEKSRALHLSYEDKLESLINSEQIQRVLESQTYPRPECQRPQNFYICRLSIDSSEKLISESFKNLCRGCKSGDVSPLPCSASYIEPPEVLMPRFGTLETDVHTRVSIFFVGRDDRLVDLYRYGQSTPVGYYYSICKPAMEWLLRTVDPFPAFVDAIHSRGYHGSFTTDDALHIIVHNQWNLPKSGICYFKLDLTSDRISAIIIDHNVEQVRSSLHDFLAAAPKKANGFSIIQHMLRIYASRLDNSKREILSKVLDSEVDTGKGPVTEGIGSMRAEMGRIRPSSEDRYHSSANIALSTAVNAEYMLILTDFIIETKAKYEKLRKRPASDQNSSINQMTLEDELLQAQRSIFQLQRQNLSYWHERAERQANVVGHIISRDIADESRRSGTFMMIITMFQVIFLPFTFVAQFFATGFFVFPERKVSGLTIDPQIKYMIIFGLVFTITSILILVYVGFVASTRRFLPWKKGTAK